MSVVKQICEILYVLTGEAWEPRYDSQGHCYTFMRIRNEKTDGPPPKAREHTND